MRTVKKIISVQAPWISRDFLSNKIRFQIEVSQMLDVWPIYLQNWVVFGVNVGKYTIH